MLKKFLFISEESPKTLVFSVLSGCTLLALFKDAGCDLTKLVRENKQSPERDFLHLVAQYIGGYGVRLEVHANCLCSSWKVGTLRILIKKTRDFLKKNPNWEYVKDLRDKGNTGIEIAGHILDDLEQFLNLIDSVGGKKIHFMESHTSELRMDKEELIIDEDEMLIKETKSTVGGRLRDKEDVETLQEQLKDMCVKEVVSDGRKGLVFVTKANSKYSREDADRRARILAKYVIGPGQDGQEIVLPEPVNFPKGGKEFERWDELLKFSKD